MTAQDLKELLRTRPFVPFRIHASDGRTYDVRHPDMAFVMLSRVILPAPPAKDIPERSEHLALSYMIRAEELPAEAIQSSGDGNHDKT